MHCIIYKCFTFSCLSLEKYSSPVRRTRIKDKGTLLDPLAWFKKAVEALYESYAAVLSTLSKFAAEKMLLPKVCTNISVIIK